MLHRNMRTAGVDLPGVGSKDVPLIGYRPLQPGTDSSQVADQPGKEVGAKEHAASQVSLVILVIFCAGLGHWESFLMGVQQKGPKEYRSLRSTMK